MQIEHQLVHVILMLGCPESVPPEFLATHEAVRLDGLRHTDAFRKVALNVFGLELCSEGKPLHRATMAETVRLLEKQKPERKDLGTFASMGGSEGRSLKGARDVLKGVSSSSPPVYYYNPLKRRWLDDGVLVGVGEYMARIQTESHMFDLAFPMIVPTTRGIIKALAPPLKPLPRGFYGDSLMPKQQVFILPLPGSPAELKPQLASIVEIVADEDTPSISFVVSPISFGDSVPDRVTVPEQMVVPQAYALDSSGKLIPSDE